MAVAGAVSGGGSGFLDSKWRRELDNSLRDDAYSCHCAMHHFPTPSRPMSQGLLSG
jgi:hypothetical protein